MALRARYGPGNRAWSYQRPAEDISNGPPPLPSAFGLTLSAEEHTPVPEARIDPDAPTLTAADAARTANGAAKARARNDGASAARAARAAKASAARSARASGGGAVAPEGDAAPRRRSGRVPATTAKARAASPTHTAAGHRTVKRKRSTLPPDAAADAETESESASRPSRDGLLPPGGDDTTDAEQDPAAPRAARAGAPKRPRVSQKDLDVKPPRDGDDTKRTTFGSTTTAPDPFTSLSAADLSSNQDPQASINIATNGENPHADARRLPPGVLVHRYLSGLYRRYPVSQVGLPKEVIADVKDMDTNVALPPNTIPNAAPFLNLYAPRRTRGIGADKHGLCPICAEPPSRGGRGKAMMLNMKTSAFNYHMQYVHGLSPKTGLPFSPPIAFRSAPRKTVGAREKATLEEGLCHACQRWIVVEGVKAVDVLVPEIYWWKHASTCHKSRMLEGEGDFYVEDPLFLRIVQWQRDHPATTTNRETTRAPTAPAVQSKAEPMEVDLQQPATARPGATTPVRPNQDDPDSSPLSSLDGTDARSPARKASAQGLGTGLAFPPSAQGLAFPPGPGLSFPPSARGPFGPPSPTSAAGFAIGTPQLVNHALPGTLPGTPQTTASVTPVLSGAALPAVGTSVHDGTGTGEPLLVLSRTYEADRKLAVEDAEARSVADSGVELSPRDQPTKTTEGEEGEDEDAEGEDDPTATAENTPVIPLLPVLPDSVAPDANGVNAPANGVSVEQAPINAEQASEPLLSSAATFVGEQQPVSMLGVEQVAEDVQMPDAPTEQVPIPIPGAESQSGVPQPQMETVPAQAPAQIVDVSVVPTPMVDAPAVPAQMVDATAVAPMVTVPVVPVPMQMNVPVPADPTQVPSIPLELPNMGDVASVQVPTELPAVQGMDMYAGNATPNEGETSQLVLTEEDLALASGDLALANGLAGPEMSLVGEEAAIPGGELELPTAGLEAIPVPQVAPEPVLPQIQAVSGLSSGEGTPNPGGEPDMFAFWNA